MKQLSVKPLKKFSQNFLIDFSIPKKIVDHACIQKDDHVVEIGPGTGALTTELLKNAKKLTAIEIDTRLYKLLSSHNTPHLNIINEDIQKIKLSSLSPQPIRLFGNLPYHLSTSIITKIIEEKNCIQDAYIMLQKEFAQRLCAIPATKSWGKLSIFIQRNAEVEWLFGVSKNAFQPAPKVDSAVIRIRPRKKILLPVTDEKKFERMLTNAFSKRRKNLLNALSDWLKPEDFKTLYLDPQRRPETLKLEEWYNIFQLKN